MKIRTGFVSNSSSSSFCIIGTENEDSILKLSEAEHKDFNPENDDAAYLSYGYEKGEVVTFYGYECEPSYAGIPIEDFGENKTIKQMKEEFIKIVKKKLDVDIPEKSVGFYYGEVGE